MTADTNGWADTPEDERETLERWDRASGYHLEGSLVRITESRRHIAQSQARVLRTAQHRALVLYVPSLN